MSSSSIVKNPLKAALRKRIKDTLLTLTLENKRQQSDAITKKVCAFHKSLIEIRYYYFCLFVRSFHLL